MFTWPVAGIVRGRGSESGLARPAGRPSLFECSGIPFPFGQMDFSYSPCVSIAIESRIVPPVPQTTLAGSMVPFVPVPQTTLKP